MALWRSKALTGMIKASLNGNRDFFKLKNSDFSVETVPFAECKKHFKYYGLKNFYDKKEI